MTVVLEKTVFWGGFDLDGFLEAGFLATGLEAGGLTGFTAGSALVEAGSTGLVFPAFGGDCLPCVAEVFDAGAGLVCLF